MIFKLLTLLLLFSVAACAQVACQGACAITGTVSLEIQPPFPLQIVTTSPLPSGIVNVPYASVQFQGAQGFPPYTWSLVFGQGSLPAGMSLTSGGLLFGTPSQAGDRSFEVEMTDSHGNFVAAPFTMTVFASAQVAGLPQIWADDRECLPDGTYAVKTLGVEYPNTEAGLQQAIRDWATDGTDDGWRLVNPNGTASPLLITDKGGITLWGKPNATKCFVIDAAGAALPTGQTVCSHKTIDNNDGSSPRNYKCTNDVGSMGAIQTNNSGPQPGSIFSACTYKPSDLANPCQVPPNHYMIKNQEIYQCGLGSVPSPCGKPITQSSLMSFDDGDETGQFGSSHIWLYGNYMHGDACYGLGGDACAAQPSGNVYEGVTRIVTMAKFTSCSFCGAVFNYVDRCATIGLETHAFSQIWSPGPNKYNANWIEGCGSTIFFGGSGGTVKPYQNSFDVEMRNNRFTKPVEWLNLSNHQANLVMKNDFEMKSCTRCLLDGDIFENSSSMGGQKGQGVTFTPRNTSGGNTGENYSSTIQDVTLSNSIIRHVLVGIVADGHGGSKSNGGGANIGARRWSIYNNLFYDIAPTSGIYNQVNIPHILPFGNANICYGVDPLFAGKCLAASGGLTEGCTATGTVGGTQITIDCPDHQIGFDASQTQLGDTLAVLYCSDPSYNTPTRGGTCNIGGNSGPCQSEGWVATTGTNPNSLHWVLNMYGGRTLGSPLATGCMVMNSQTYPAAVSFYHNTMIGFGQGSAGTPPFTSEGSCTGPDTFAQSTIYRDNLNAFYPPNLSGYACQGTGLKEGTSSEQNMHDTASLTLTHVTIPGAQPSVTGLTISGSSTGVLTGNYKYVVSASTAGGELVGSLESAISLSGQKASMNWTAVSGATIYTIYRTVAGGATGSETVLDTSKTNSYLDNKPDGALGTAAPPYYTEYNNGVATSCITGTCPGLWFPAHVACQNPAADSTCIGFGNMLNKGANPDNSYVATDLYSNFVLDPSSLYYHGNARQASDGTSMGADISAITTALTLNKYSCGANPCGAGPFPNN